MSRALQFLQYVWPLPNTIFGLIVGCTPLLGKRKFVVRRGTIGIYGPGMSRILSKAPIPGGAIALTLGHVILAADERSFQESFEHEWIHVKQYVWWGPFFIPAYFLNSLWHWCIGQGIYIDNDFEVQARKWSGF
jgi:hypothetical protein